MRSRVGCATKTVHKLHEETMAYTERARKILSQAVVSSSEGTESPEGEDAEGIQR